MHVADHARDWFYEVTFDEDYLTGYGVQRGLPALGTTRRCSSGRTSRACSTSTGPSTT